MRTISMLLAALFLLSSCGNNDKAPKGILKPEKMQAVLWDVIKADVFTSDFIKKDSSKNAAEENAKLQQQVFALHKVTREDFLNSYDYYKEHAVEFKKIVDSMAAQAERNRNKNIKTISSPLKVNE